MLRAICAVPGPFVPAPIAVEFMNRPASKALPARCVVNVPPANGRNGPYDPELAIAALSAEANSGSPSCHGYCGIVALMLSPPTFHCRTGCAANTERGA